MDKFVKRENEMWKMPAKEHIQTRIGAEKRVQDFQHQLSVCPPATHLKMFRQKETQKCDKTSLERTSDY